MNPRSIIVSTNSSFPLSEYAAFLIDYLDLDASSVLCYSGAQESQHLASMLQQTLNLPESQCIYLPPGTGVQRNCVMIVAKAEFEGFYRPESGSLQGDEIAVEDCYVTVIEKEFWWYHSLKCSAGAAPAETPRIVMQWKPGRDIHLRISVANSGERIDAGWLVAFANDTFFWQQEVAVERGMQDFLLRGLSNSAHFSLWLSDGQQWVASLDFP